MGNGAGRRPTVPAPRSDACVLHVDAEQYVDTLIGINNAGVRWLGEPWVPGTYGVTEVTRGFAFAGERALHAATLQKKQRAMIPRREGAVPVGVGGARGAAPRYHPCPWTMEPTLRR